MTTNINPVAGNQFFSRVSNVAGQVANLNVGEVTAGDLKGTNLNVENITSTVLSSANMSVQSVKLDLPGIPRTFYTVLGYLPSDFGTLSGTPLTLNKSHGLVADLTGQTGTRLLLPTGASIIGLIATNNGTPWIGGVDSSNVFNIGVTPAAGLAVANSTLCVPSVIFFQDGQLGVVVGEPVSGSAVGTGGTSIDAGRVYINGANNAITITSDGTRTSNPNFDMVVRITYYMSG